jgi:hypothetical protein
LEKLIAFESAHHDITLTRIVENKNNSGHSEISNYLN